MRTSWCADSNGTTAIVLSEPLTSGFAARPKPLPEAAARSHRKRPPRPQTPLRPRLSDPCAIRGSPRPATCQKRRLKLSTVRGALQRYVRSWRKLT